jgi:putative hydrolase of the HAD superfamily
VLDVGGVFLVPQEEAAIPALASAGITTTNADVERAHFMGVAAVDQRADDGDDRPAYLLAYVASLGVRREEQVAAVDALLPAWHLPSIELWRHVLEDSVSALRLLARACVPLAIVSNSDGWVEAELRTHTICQVGPGAGVEVACIVDSGVLGVAKPDPAVFAPAIAAVGVDPSDVIYVGDCERYDVIGARRAGMVPVHFDPYHLCHHMTDHRHIASLHELTGG